MYYDIYYVYAYRRPEPLDHGIMITGQGVDQWGGSLVMPKRVIHVGWHLAVAPVNYVGKCRNKINSVWF